MRPWNFEAWALGEMRGRRFNVRRVVWGRMMARSEKRKGELIRRVHLEIVDPPKRKGKD